MDIQERINQIENILQDINRYIAVNESKINDMIHINILSFVKKIIKEFDLTTEKIKTQWHKMYPNWQSITSNGVTHNNYITLGLFLFMFYIEAILKRDESYTEYEIDEMCFTVYKLYAIMVYNYSLGKFFSRGVDSMLAMNVLDTLSGNHVFKKAKTLSEALFMQAREVFDRYKEDVFKVEAVKVGDTTKYVKDPKPLFKMMHYFFTTFIRSMKRFAQKYYDLFDKVQKELTDGRMTNQQTIPKEEYINHFLQTVILQGYISEYAIKKTRELLPLSNAKMEAIASSISGNLEIREEAKTLMLMLYNYFIQIGKTAEFIDEEEGLKIIRNIIKAKNITREHIKQYMISFVKILLDTSEGLRILYMNSSDKTKSFMSTAIIVYMYLTFIDIMDVDK